ncbi:MAG: amidohydrolase [Treponema sp.]|nr:amidohydrolase [Treponema sp.]
MHTTLPAIEIFKHLHENPELSFQEFKTTDYIKEVLSAEEIEILPLPLKTGLVARVRGEKAGKKIAFRADIDALPIEEKNALPYRSKHTGIMHACGHDIHTTVAIETARILQHNRNKLRGEVLFVFQPAEEAGNGAFEILNTHVLEGTDAIFSLHTSPVLEVGEIGIKEGAITAAVDILSIKITGRGAHGAQPQDGRDPIVASAAIITALQSIVARNISPFRQAVVSITRITGGSSWNIIPSDVLLEGTVRTTDNALRDFIAKRIHHIVEQTACAYDETAQVSITKGPPATNNDKTLADYAWQMAQKLNFKPVRPEVTMVGEDFAHYQSMYKGIMVWLGVGKTHALHSPEFQADPEAIAVGTQYFSELLMNK